MCSDYSDRKINHSIPIYLGCTHLGVSGFDHLKTSAGSQLTGAVGSLNPGLHSVFSWHWLAAPARLLDERLKLVTDVLPIFQKLLTPLRDSTDAVLLLLLLLLRHVGPVYTRAPALLCLDNDEPRAIALYNITMHYTGLAAHVHIIGW